MTQVVLRECGYDVVEFNASDTRSQKALKELVSDLVDNRSIADFATKGGSGLARAAAGQMALVMDEVDGMSSGDRGGMAQLIALIKAAKLPVVCICNDRGDAKVRSLANHCLDLRFRRPGPREVCDVLRRVASAEGYTVDDATLERVAGACNADIRQMLNLLQMWQPKDSSRLADGGMVSTMSSTFKDVKVSNPCCCMRRLYCTITSRVPVVLARTRSVICRWARSTWPRSSSESRTRRSTSASATTSSTRAWCR